MLFDLGLPAIAYSQMSDRGQRTLDGAEAYNEKGLIPTAVRTIKARGARTGHHYGRGTRPMLPVTVKTVFWMNPAT